RHRHPAANRTCRHCAFAHHLQRHTPGKRCRPPARCAGRAEAACAGRSRRGMSQPEVIARHFGAAAPHYDQHARLQRDVADRLSAFLPQQLNAEVVLDLGCGTGYCSERLRRRLPDSHLLCLDLALPMLKRSALRGVEGSLVCADAVALPFPGSSVDLLFSSLAIQWCEDLPQLFAEVRRVLRPGGLALFSTFGPATLQELREAWAEVDVHR